MMPDHVYSIGRNDSYRYGLDIDDCIEQAMIGQADQGRRPRLSGSNGGVAISCS